MVQRGGPRLALQPQSRWSWLQTPPPTSVPTVCYIKSFGPSSCLPILCPSPQIFQVRAPRRPRANTRAGPPTQERRAGSGTQQGAASGGRCRADCAEGTGHTRCMCPHLHTRVHTQAALTHKHVCTYRCTTPCTHKHTHTRADTQTRGICLWARMRRSASTHTHTRGLTLRDVKAHVPTHHSGVRTLTHTQERALSGGRGRGWAHRAPIRRQEAPLTAGASRQSRSGPENVHGGVEKQN